MRPVIVASLLSLLAAPAGAQLPGHKAVLDRLNGLTSLPSIAWRVHPADIAHGEAVDLDDSSWVKGEGRVRWKGSGSWFRHTLVVPKLVGGYALANARLRL